MIGEKYQHSVNLRACAWPDRSITAVDVVLDQGLVIEASAGGALFGTTLVSIDATLLVASIDTFLRLAEIANPSESGR